MRVSLFVIVSVILLIATGCGSKAEPPKADPPKWEDETTGEKKARAAKIKALEEKKKEVDPRAIAILREDLGVETKKDEKTGKDAVETESEKRLKKHFQDQIVELTKRLPKEGKEKPPLVKEADSALEALQKSLSQGFGGLDKKVGDLSSSFDKKLDETAKKLEGAVKEIDERLKKVEEKSSAPKELPPPKDVAPPKSDAGKTSDSVTYERSYVPERARVAEVKSWDQVDFRVCSNSSNIPEPSPILSSFNDNGERIQQNNYISAPTVNWSSSNVVNSMPNPVVVMHINRMQRYNAWACGLNVYQRNFIIMHHGSLWNFWCKCGF